MYQKDYDFLSYYGSRLTFSKRIHRENQQVGLCDRASYFFSRFSATVEARPH